MTTARSLRPFSVLLGSMIAAALACLAVAATAAARGPLPSPLALVYCLALLFAGVRFHLPIRLGAQRVELTWSEAGLVLALAVAPTPWVVLMNAAAVSVSLGTRHFAMVKTLYNVASCTVAAAAAVGLLTLVRVSRPFAGVDLFAVAAAGAVEGLVTYLAVAAAVAVVQNVGLFATWRAAGGLQILTLAGNLGFAAVVLLLVRRDPRLILALLPLGFLLRQGYIGRFRAHQERQSGRRKPVAINHLTADLDEPAVIRRTAEEVAVLMQADAVDVEVLDATGSPSLLYRHFRRGDPWIGAPREARPGPGHLAARVSITGQGRAPIGEVRVWLASSATDLAISSSDQDAVEMLAAAAATALANARIYAEQRRLARTDRTTGLPTRQVLLERIEETGRQPAGSTRPSVALILIDVTGFRGVVRALGHDTAEELLARTGRQLRAAGAGEDLAFVAGDDFAVYLKDAGDPARVRDLATSLVDAVAEPLQLPVGTVTLDAVAGIAYSPVPVTSGVELLRQAIYAMEQARARSLQADFYDPGEDTLGGPAGVVMASELHEALENGELDFHYQPIVHLSSRAPLAIEALVRWSHPTKGLMLPGEFMPVLEQSRDHGRFVSWQLDRALQARALWGDDRDLPVSVNLAARCFLDKAFPNQVQTALEKWQVAPHQLMLELTDTPALTGSATATAVLTGLLDLGVRIAVDGFGTGGGSLIGLLELPATDVKIGSEFVRLLPTDGRATGVVRIAIELGRLSDLRVTALGVPDDEHVEALRRAGCTVGQGNYLAPPMVASELRDYLATAPPTPPDHDADVVHLDSKRLARRT